VAGNIERFSRDIRRAPERILTSFVDVSAYKTSALWKSERILVIYRQEEEPLIRGSDSYIKQLDATLNQFQAAYAKARAAGEAIAMSWKPDATPGAPPPSDSYTSTSYLASDNWYA
jgi:hypothetical protein